MGQLQKHKAKPTECKCMMPRDKLAKWLTQWKHILQGTLVSETRCLACKTVTTREEAFYDLSLDIEQNCSLTACLQNFRYLLLIPICYSSSMCSANTAKDQSFKWPDL